MEEQDVGLGWTIKDWRKTALVLHLVALVFAGTFYAMVARAPAPSVSGIMLLIAAGVGSAAVPIAIGLFGLLNKRNRIVGFVVVSWIALIVMFAFLSKAPTRQEATVINQADQTQSISPVLQGAWSCTDLITKKTSSLVLSPDGSVSVSSDNVRLIKDPWLHWYHPIQANGDEQLILLRIRPEVANTIVVHNPSGNVMKCVR